MSKSKKVSKLNVKNYFRVLSDISTPTLVIENKTQKIFASNSAFEDLSGFTLDVIKEKDVHSFFSDKDHTRVESFLDVLKIHSGELSEINLSLRKWSGRRVDVNLFGKTVHVGNKRTFTILTLHCLEEIKKLQKEKEATIKEMSHVSKLADIGRLAAGVAHELNNPLMIIQGFAENIEILIEGGECDRTELRMQLNPILKATGRMSKIIAQLTRLSRDDKGIAFVQVDLVDVIEDVLNLVKNQLKHNDIELKKNYSGSFLARCDPNQIEQIILNIINNAVHALSKITSHRLLEVTLEESKGLVRLCLKNNGPEIPTKIKDKILTPFFTTKEVGEGTGLGLSVSYGIMKAHDGDLTFSSSQSKGTKFSLVFPRIVRSSETLRKLEGTGIVVDDEEMTRKLIATKLRRFGFKIFEAENGADALEIFNSTKNIDFIFTDANMPVMDGSTLVKNLRRLSHDLLIYVITGFTGIRSIEQEMTSHGVNGFLPKPLDHEKFSDCIKEIDEKVNSARRVSRKKTG